MFLVNRYREKRKSGMEKCYEKLYPLVITALVAVCYSNSLGCGLVFDDIAAIRDNRDLRPHTPLGNIFVNDFWGTPLKKEHSHKSYRPLCVFTFRLNYAVHGLHPLGYHLVNVLLHIVICLLYYRLCLQLMPETTSVVASALFAVHPIHTEAVAGVVGRAELLSAVFFLSALLYFIKHRFHSCTTDWWRYSLVWLLAVLGMLCKEQALTVLAICCVYELVSIKFTEFVASTRYILLGRGILSPWIRESISRIAFLIVSAAVTLWVRLQIIGPKFPVFNRFDNPASVSNFPTRHLTYNYLLPVNVWLLLFPCDLCCDWTMSTIPLVTFLCDIRNIFTVALYATVALLLRSAFKMEEDHKLIVIMALALVVVPFLPASNLLFPVGFVVAERVLYLPSMGFCVLVAQGWTILWDKRNCKTLAAVGLILLILVHVMKTTRRNYDWQSEYTLYSSALAVNQRNAKLFNNMGQVLESMNRKEEVLRYYREAIRIQPDDIRGYLNLGRVLTSLSRYEKAEEVYLQAMNLLPQHEVSARDLHVTPSHLQLFLNMAFLISQNESRLEEADSLYREAIRLRSDFTDAYLNRGDVLLKMNRTKEAEAMYHRALQFDDRNPDLYYNLGVVLMDQGRNEEALKLFNKALEIDPDHEKSLVFSAILIQESGMWSHKNLARDRLERMVGQGKQNERIYINLGLLAVENKDPKSAENWFRKAVKIQSNSRGALFNLALLLSEQQRPLEAISFLKQLLTHHPNHLNGLILLADIYITHLKDLDLAEECYQKVLLMDPDNLKGRHNLCVVYVERGDLHRAEECFVQVSRAHPEVDYIRHHLKVTQELIKKQRHLHQTGIERELSSGPDSAVLQHFASSPTIR